MVRDLLEGAGWGALIAFAITPWILLTSPQSPICQPNPLNGPVRILSEAAR